MVHHVVMMVSLAGGRTLDVQRSMDEVWIHIADDTAE